MSQPVLSAPPVRESLPGLPRGALTAQQQIEALERIQSQAEQRVKLGLQLFKAAEAHTLGYQEILSDLKQEREKLRDEVAGDVARSLQTYDQWIGQMDDTFTDALLALEAKVDSLEEKIDAIQGKLQAMLAQAEKMLAQATELLAGQTVTPSDDHVVPPC